MRKVVSLVSVLMLLLCLLPTFQFPAVANNEDPNPDGKIYGPWTISVSKSYKDVTIEVGGNLTIMSGGTLTLDNVNLIMNSTPAEEFYITVEAGGNLQILNGSVVTRNATYNRPYFLTVGQGAQFKIERSELHGMGNSSATIGIGSVARMGLLLQTTNAEVLDSIIADSFAGTVCMNLIQVTPKIINTTYRNNTIGLAVSMGCTPVMHDNIYIENQAGFMLAFKPQGQTGLAKDKFYNNTVAVGATMSPLGLQDIVIENSTEAGIGAMGGSKIDVRNVVLKGNKNATFVDNSSMLMRDSVVTMSGQWDFFVNNVSNVKVLNCTIDDRTGIKVNDTNSLFELQWYLNVMAEYMTGGTVTGALVNVTDTKNALAYSTATNTTGWTTDFVVSELRDAGNGAVALTPHNVTAEKGAFWNKSQVTVDHSQNIIVRLWERDLVKPTIGIASPADGTFLNSMTVEVQGMASDDKGLAKVELDNGSGTWALASGSTTWYGNVTLVGDGDHQICAKATDTSGNNVSACVDVTLDTYRPALTVSEPTNGMYFNHSQMFVRGSTDADVISVNGDNVGIFNNNFSYPLTLTKEGANDIVLVAKDLAGNENTTSLRVYRDLIAPTIVALSPQPGAIVPSMAFAVAGNVTDAQGLVGMWASPDNVTWTSADVNYTNASRTSGAFIANFLRSEGAHSLYFKAADNAGNIGRASLNITVKLPDVTPPAIVITEPKNGDRVTGLAVMVRGTSSDDEHVDRVELGLDGSNWTSADSSDSWAHWSLNLSLTEGSNTIYARALDPTGNKRTEVVTITAVKPVVDTEKPVISLTSHKEGQTVNKAKITLRGAVSDNVKVKAVYVSLTGAGGDAQWVAASVDPVSHSWSLDITLKQGWNEIAVQASDEAGNTNTTIVSLRYQKPQQNEGLPYLMIIGFVLVLLILAVVYVLTLPGREKARKAKDEPVPDDEDEDSVDKDEEE